MYSLGGMYVDAEYTDNDMYDRVEVLVDLSDPDRDLINQRTEVMDGSGNLLSSELKHMRGFHAPTLDIDMYCALHGSTTPGHFHLYIDKPMSWVDYVKLLTTLRDVGIIQPGYCDLSLARGASYLRKPGIVKVESDAPDS